MRPDPTNADHPQASPDTAAPSASAQAAWPRPARVRSLTTPQAYRTTANLITSLGMIASLLLIWATIATM